MDSLYVYDFTIHISFVFLISLTSLRVCLKPFVCFFVSCPIWPFFLDVAELPRKNDITMKMKKISFKVLLPLIKGHLVMHLTDL